LSYSEVIAIIQVQCRCVLIKASLFLFCFVKDRWINLFYWKIWLCL